MLAVLQMAGAGGAKITELKYASHLTREALKRWWPPDNDITQSTTHFLSVKFTNNTSQNTLYYLWLIYHQYYLSAKRILVANLSKCTERM